ncbi:putative uncharacterized protein DDB_G0289263 [Uranotaenia lowii]|uniref:putative uncharacterized protein DDB_G0289263 n=1 Tax=Uranotaenia lowii TaxID=190385 RepID=UPI00247B0A1D|nr:putative uncharacterized protein DDB_G0289263 [Uranotaenia lowii]
MYEATASDTHEKQANYYTFLLGLETKIVGAAQEVLAKNNCETNFRLMEKLLIDAFGNKKRIEHLLYEITIAEQKGRTTNEFYNHINDRLNQIIASTILKYGSTNAAPLIEQYKTQAISAFLRGLNGITGTIIAGYQPQSMEEALHHALTIDANAMMKSDIFSSAGRHLSSSLPGRNHQRFQNQSTFKNNFNNNLPPSLPPRNNHNQQSKDTNNTGNLETNNSNNNSNNNSSINS